jgi:DUF917 family protein
MADDLYGRSLTVEDIEALEIGSGILGTGGGGNPYIGKLRAREILREGYEMRLAPLETLDDDARIVPLGGIGAPLISFERIKEGREGLRCLRALEKHLDFQADAVGCEEIGGQNSMEPLIVAAMAGLPVVDGDGMGRAFPEMQMTTYSIYGHRSTPSVMCDLHGNVVVFEHAISEKWHETLARACVIAQGGSSVLAGAPMSGAFMKRYAIPNTYSQAIGLGRAVLDARRLHEDPIETICRREGGRHVFSGKITDLTRHFKGGFNVGIAQLGGLAECAGSTAEIVIQNEFLIFSRDGEMEVCVPDLVVVLELDTGLPITTEMLRYGQRVAVLALPCHRLLRTSEALDVIGPAAFGHPDITYRPMVEEMEHEPA